MASIPLAPAVCRRLDLQYHRLAASTSHLLPTTARWPVEISDLATRPPRRPSTGSRLADSLDGLACLAVLLLPDHGDPSDPASPFAGSFRFAHALHHLPSEAKIQYYDSWDKSFSCSIVLLLQELSQLFPSLPTPLPISWNQWLVGDKDDGRVAWETFCVF